MDGSLVTLLPDQPLPLPPPAPSSPSSAGSSGLSTGSLAGIVVGSVAGAALLLAGLSVLLLQRRCGGAHGATAAKEVRGGSRCYCCKRGAGGLTVLLLQRRCGGAYGATAAKEVPCGGAMWRCRVEVLAAGSGAGVSLVGFWVVAAGLSAGLGCTHITVITDIGTPTAIFYPYS